MKINYTTDGLEDLTGYVYNYKNNIFTKDDEQYRFIIECSFCGKAFMGEINGTHQFCDRLCRGVYMFHHSFAYLL